MSSERSRHETQLLTLADVALYLSISQRSVRRLIEQGELRVIRVGRQLRVSPLDLDAYVAAQRR